MAAAASLGLTALVGLAATASPWHAAGGGGLSGRAVDVLVVVPLALLAAAALAGLAVAMPRRRRTAVPPADLTGAGAAARTGLITLVAGLAGLAAFLALAVLALGQAGALHQPASPSRAPGAGQATTPGSASPRAPGSLDVGAEIAALGVALLVLVPAALVVRRRLATSDRVAAQEEDGDAVARAVGAAVEDLSQEDDPRQAVIRAYARMERSLAAAGLPREPPETPFEYVGRALETVGVGLEPAQRLAGLFERARFSQHPVGEPLRAEAAAALEAVRGELGPP
jgi:hypothetical protein